MEEKYLIVNAGSSSLKFSLYSMPSGNEIVKGIVEKIGEENSSYTLKSFDNKVEKQKLIMNHIEAVQTMISELLENHFISDIENIKGVGHRILHGGEKYSDSVLINEEVLNDIRSLTKLGPIHHPVEILEIESIKKYLPDVPQVAVFDTAFHQTMPKENYLYAVPYSWYEENGVRKYGFHGTSHKYITCTMQEMLKKDDVNLIICHIGSGASISVIKNGKCLNTTMGLTPLDGVIMGTRSGSIDPSILEYICKEKNLSIEEVTNILNKESGLLGIAGKNDFRDLEKLASVGNERSNLAIKMLKSSIIKYIAQYYFELEGKIDAIVFTAGILENAINLRSDIIKSLSNPMNIKLDDIANNNIARFKTNQTGVITTPDSSFPVIVIPTNEEYIILKDTYRITKQNKKEKVKLLTR